jgi:hypothetical protein
MAYKHLLDIYIICAWTSSCLRLVLLICCFPTYRTLITAIERSQNSLELPLKLVYFMRKDACSDNGRR